MKTKHISRLTCGLILAAIFAASTTHQSAWFESPLSATSPPVVQNSPQPFYSRYIAEVESAAKKVRADMPAISKSAEAAAKAYVDGKNFGIRGGLGLNDELGARAGGMCLYRAGKGAPGDVILYAFSMTLTKDAADPKAAIEKLIADAKDLKAKGSQVYGIASFEQLKSLGLFEQAKEACDTLLDNHGPAVDQFPADATGGAPAVPIYTSLNPIVAWVWSAEFFAACTRLGKVPAHYQSIVDDPERVRYDKYKAVRFHDDMTVPAIDLGKLGNEYLDSLLGSFDAINKQSDKLKEATQRASAAIKDGGKAHLYATGHYPPYHAAGQLAADPKVLTPLSPARGKNPGTADPTENDMTIVIGYSIPPVTETEPQKKFWGPALEKTRKSGKGVVWVISGFLTKPGDVLPNEILIDQSWPKGDAVVKVPGYDVNICPTSGIIAETLMWAIAGQVALDVAGKRAAEVKTPDSK